MQESGAYLKEGVLVLGFKLVRAKKFETTCGLLSGKTVVVALKQLEDVVDYDGLQVDLFLVIQIFRLELNLRGISKRFHD